MWVELIQITISVGGVHTRVEVESRLEPCCRAKLMHVVHRYLAVMSQYYEVCVGINSSFFPCVWSQEPTYYTANMASSMSDVYYVGSCDYTQVEKSLASETKT